MLARILIDNITKNEFASEWGLAAWIEHNGHSFLLDTGATGAFIENADAMKLDIERAEFGVLSHAHYDHADGLAAFFQRNAQAKFYLRRGCAENCYGKRWIFSKYIGIQKGNLTRYSDRIVYVDGDYEIIPGVTLVPHKTPGLELIGKKAGMYIKKNGRQYPDCFSHEQSLVINTERGLIIFNSCSHGGADNIILEVMKTFPDQKLYALIGGFHLYRSSDEEVHALADRIQKTGIETIYTGHCTGDRALEILRKKLGDRVQQFYAGMEIVL
ncbi:MAG: MBL fold metallo-hydrolase [Oscillospiraceae bacterium]|jgi:7,8-dihydropterin-6-yl-methyl-4-(beta-D-ribofuranosyl)aminobenzene 5'-phosphate synthase